MLLILFVLKGIREIEGIMFHPPTSEIVDQWTNAALENIKNLKVLIVRNATFST